MQTAIAGIEKYEKLIKRLWNNVLMTLGVYHLKMQTRYIDFEVNQTRNDVGHLSEILWNRDQEHYTFLESNRAIHEVFFPGQHH